MTPMASLQEHRSHVGPVEAYDLMAAMQFNLLTYLGLRERDYLLDIGCGSLRAGRLFIPYLDAGHYFGIEPEQWLLQNGIDNEVGQSLIDLKRPRFSHNGEFLLTEFKQHFDYILAQSIFSHASQAQIRKCFAQASQALKPEGLFAASFFRDETDYTGDQWTVKATYTLKRMQELADEAGLKCIALDWPHTDFQTWLLIAHRDYQVRLADLSGAHRILQLQAEIAELRRHHDYLVNHPWNRIGIKLHSLVTLAVFKRRQFLRAVRSALRQPARPATATESLQPHSQRVGGSAEANEAPPHP